MWSLLLALVVLPASIVAGVFAEWIVHWFIHRPWLRSTWPARWHRSHHIEHIHGKTNHWLLELLSYVAVGLLTSMPVYALFLYLDEPWAAAGWLAGTIGYTVAVTVVHRRHHHHGSPDHMQHHYVPCTNLGTTTTLVDRLFGTYVPGVPRGEKGNDRA